MAKSKKRPNKSGDVDAGAAPSKQPASKKATSKKPTAQAKPASGVPPSLLAAAAAIGAHNAGAAPALAGRKTGAPVLLSNSLSQPSASDFSAGAAPAHLSNQRT
jgi:hypothetical protein